MPKGFSKENNNWTKAELDVLKRNKYLCSKDIAKLLRGRTPKAIRSMFSKLKIARKDIINEVWTKMELHTLTENAQKLSVAELKLLLPTRSEWAIKHKYNQLGINRQSFAGYVKDFQMPVESEDYAYFLGALCSDGWNSGDSIGLTAKDKDFVEAFGEIGFNLFGVTFISRVINRHLINHAKQQEVQFVSRRICNFLGDVSEGGWFNNPNVQFVEKNKRFALAFLSGYIDGDGHIGEYNVIVASKIDGAKKFLSYLIGKFGNDFVVRSDIIRLNKPLVDKIRNKLTLKIKRKSEALRW
jgi:hypothetical protein